MPSSSQPFPPGPLVRHFRQILMWPLQLMPLRPGTQVQRHWAHLDECAGPNPWRELADEFTADPTEFQERHYREFVTFLPHVQRFLYGHGRSGGGGSAQGESPIRVFRRTDVAAARLTYDDGGTVDLAIQHVDLYFFYDMDVVILVLEVFADDLPLNRVQDTLFRFGRAFPAGWEPDGRALHCMRRVAWLDCDGRVLAQSDMDDRGKYLAYAGEHRSTSVGAHWEFLLRPLVQHHSAQTGPIRYRQLEYHRMPKLSYLSVDDPFALSTEDFVRLALGTRADDGRGLQYSPQVIEQFRQDYFYDRFWAPGRGDLRASTRVACTGHAMVMVGSHRDAMFTDAEAGLLGQFRHQYFLVGLIPHFHKAALLMLSDRLVSAVSRLDIQDPESVREFKSDIRQSQEILLRFNHRYWFHEVSNQSMAKDLYAMWSRHLGNDALFDEVRTEALDMGQYLDSDDSRRQGEAVLRLTVVTIFGLVGTIVTGFLGMNLLAEADQPLAVKLLLFVAVLVPTALLTMVTVHKSRDLSEVLDLLGDDRLSWKDRFARLRRVASGRATKGSASI